MLGLYDRLISQESPPISKRKPPSQRPERKLDETARAIARSREEAIAVKAEESQKSGRKESTAPVPTHAGRVGSQFKAANGPAPTVSTKQPKNPGS